MDFISKEIRKLRKEQGITLKELSKMTELSVSFLSQVERGTSSMTITSLKKIADALGVTMKELLKEEDKNELYTTKKENQNLSRLDRSFMKYMRLSGKFESRDMEAILMKIEPNSKDEGEVPHKGEEFHYVLKGNAVFSLDGERYEIKEGESIHFPSTIPHSVSNEEDEEVVILSVLTIRLF